MLIFFYRRREREQPSSPPFHSHDGLGRAWSLANTFAYVPKITLNVPRLDISFVFDAVLFFSRRPFFLSSCFLGLPRARFMKFLEDIVGTAAQECFPSSNGKVCLLSFLSADSFVTWDMTSRARLRNHS
ncbi:hypothetical protein NPIL_70971 [Nephila pilipes]|uniref:Uncharacterized protein n=1 Tax=Nephila pilipes TaxID=299642 RepID=A0A8X6MUG3_NEPPI|nr:hypothetical protein NPIL_70971 [Nephila pilipes]